ncbi:MAG TPA: pilus assembly protein N-terminal domain-containing protein [Rhizomicrobium sp.]|jgi:hypothetical protein
MRNAIRTVLLTTIAFCAGAPALAASGGISLPMDEGRVIAFSQPVQTVFVGNPTMADVNMIDPRHAFILGKSFGSTNLIALDANGRAVASRHVTILGGASLVTLNRASEQYTYACTNARCEHSRVPGDPQIPYNEFQGEVNSREDQGLKQAEASNGQQH